MLSQFSPDRHPVPVEQVCFTFHCGNLILHTVLELCDEQYRRVRAELAVRRTFFNDLQALTRYLYFESWPALIGFMFTQLELEQPKPSPPRRRSPRT